MRRFEYMVRIRLGCCFCKTKLVLWGGLVEIHSQIICSVIRLSYIQSFMPWFPSNGSKSVFQLPEKRQVAIYLLLHSNFFEEVTYDWRHILEQVLSLSECWDQPGREGYVQLRREKCLPPWFPRLGRCAPLLSIASIVYHLNIPCYSVENHGLVSIYLHTLQILGLRVSGMEACSQNSENSWRSLTGIIRSAKWVMTPRPLSSPDWWVWPVVDWARLRST